MRVSFLTIPMAFPAVRYDRDPDHDPDRDRDHDRRPDPTTTATATATPTPTTTTTPTATTTANVAGAGYDRVHFLVRGSSCAHSDTSTTAPADTKHDPG